MQPDCGAGQTGEFRRPADVIEVPVGVDQGDSRQAGPGESAGDLLPLVAGVHDDRLARRVIRDDRAIALQWPYWNRLDQSHGRRLSSSGVRVADGGTG